MLHNDDQLPAGRERLEALIRQADWIERETLFEAAEDLNVEELRIKLAAFDEMLPESPGDPEVISIALDLFEYFSTYEHYYPAAVCAYYIGDSYAKSHIQDVFIGEIIVLEKAKKIVEELLQREIDAEDKHEATRKTTSSKRVQQNPNKNS